MRVALFLASFVVPLMALAQAEPATATQAEDRTVINSKLTHAPTQDTTASWRGSLMFRVSEIRQLQEAIKYYEDSLKNIAAPETPTAPANDFLTQLTNPEGVVPVAAPPPPPVATAVRLDSIIYLPRSRWVVWINGNRVREKEKTENYTLERVDAQQVVLSFPRPASEPIPEEWWDKIMIIGAEKPKEEPMLEAAQGEAAGTMDSASPETASAPNAESAKEEPKLEAPKEAKKVKPRKNPNIRYLAKEEKLMVQLKLNQSFLPDQMEIIEGKLEPTAPPPEPVDIPAAAVPKAPIRMPMSDTDKIRANAEKLMQDYEQFGSMLKPKDEKPAAAPAPATSVPPPASAGTSATQQGKPLTPSEVMSTIPMKQDPPFYQKALPTPEEIKSVAPSSP